MSQPIVNVSNPGENLARLSDILIDALIELPSDKIESLITLVKAIYNLPEPDMADREESKRPAHGKLWRGLPDFGHLYADIHQSINQLARLSKRTPPNAVDYGNITLGRRGRQ
ncbi:hypothetical protein F4820DRAFT_437557 [Hypoxylon rubiginosum]|uniref:Uncharacterized protein n=1 Tax=Hypoxylon rubiginosum TaxID=110542 RepID=A0ACB9YMC4_9PEZI|nr:hypothetical protein F4820DRAFT_437557 [Hypoxylon rubiginosum]